MTRILITALIALPLIWGAPAAAMSRLVDCSDSLETMSDGIKKNNSCKTDDDCAMIASPPCGCESLSLNPENAKAASEAMRICTKEGVVCESCVFDEDAPPPAATCVSGNCKLR